MRSSRRQVCGWTLAAFAAQLTKAPDAVAAVSGKQFGISVPPTSTLKLIPEWMEISRTPALGIGLIRKGEPVWERYFGSPSEQSPPINDKTLWIAASLGKQAIVYATLRLVAAGQFDLDRPLALYLKTDKPVGPLGAAITARHVLSHTSGLPNWRLSGPLEPDFPPGSRFQYSGEGIYLLSRCIEQITNSGFEYYMQHNVFAPLQMQSSTYIWRADARARVVTGHRGNDVVSNFDFAEALFKRIASSSVPLREWNHERVSAALAEQNNGKVPLPADILYPNAAFSLLTTVQDYCRLIARFLAPSGDGLDIDPALLRETRQQIIRVNSKLGWALGFGTEQAGGERFLWQWGNNAGAWTDILLLHPESETAIVIFSNGGNGVRVEERIVQDCTGHTHPLFLWI